MTGRIRLLTGFLPSSRLCMQDLHLPDPGSSSLGLLGWFLQQQPDFSGHQLLHNRASLRGIEAQLSCQRACQPVRQGLHGLTHPSTGLKRFFGHHVLIDELALPGLQIVLGDRRTCGLEPLATDCNWW